MMNPKIPNLNQNSTENHTTIKTTHQDTQTTKNYDFKLIDSNMF